MEFVSDPKYFRSMLPVIILWGCFGGICFSAASFYLQRMDRIVEISCYSGIFSPVYPFLKYVTLMLLSFTFGMIAADMLGAGRKTGLDPIRAGLVTGACSALISIILVEVYPLGYSWISYPFTLAGSFSIILVVYIVISAIPQVLGAWYQGSRQGSGQDSGDPVHPNNSIRRSRHWFFFVAILVLLLILPLGLFAFPIDTTDYSACPEGRTCNPGDQCNWGRPPDNITVLRTGPDSIRMTLKAGSSKCGSRNSFKILLNGNDVTNQASIGKSGLNVTITPQEGLGQQDGSYAILQGMDVAVNETAPPHIQIIMTDRGTSWTHRDQYL
jgi:hypothetical protein